MLYFSRWTFYQCLIIIALIILAFIVDQFSQDIAIPVSSSEDETITPMLMTLLFISIVVGLCSLWMYFQTKKSSTFLQHQFWDKMPGIITVIFSVTLIIFLTLFMLTPLQDQRWFMYVMIYYFLYMINLLVLSVIHVSKKELPNPNKILYSGITTVFALFVIIFFI
ncbi:hypothetical protein [Piscibacillus halophilus]|uniref:hypothetical protein n=1 Tax=Piscibacillus halophilus TaxID=571933 RepID=UPI00240A0133|nr:hypothetical protein [Piscibacillus halophilus]